MTLYLGGRSLVSPLGNSLKDNVTSIVAGRSGIRHHNLPYASVPSLHASKMPADWAYPGALLSTMCANAIEESFSAIQAEKDGWLFVLSTTKADVDRGVDADGTTPAMRLLRELQDVLPVSSDAKAVSLACVSGLAALNYAADRIRMGDYKHAFVLGADLVSEFTASGFASFHALADGPCKPYDANRTGLNLGEAVAGVILSSDSSLFQTPYVKYLAGTTANDANHISGPSREGEGLFRSIQRTLKLAGKSSAEVDYISSHGTATRYNDDMESIAYDRVGLSHVPVSGLKGYYGHTLGASSLVETVLGVESLLTGVQYATLGCETQGTAKPMNLVTETREVEMRTLLKTASGFGGVNASALIEKVG